MPDRLIRKIRIERFKLIGSADQMHLFLSDCKLFRRIFLHRCGEGIINIIVLRILIQVLCQRILYIPVPLIQEIPDAEGGIGQPQERQQADCRCGHKPSAR